jgi:chromosome segregation ATPase
MGKLWGNKVEEIANLKAEKEELREELSKTQAALSALELEMKQNTASKNKAMSQISTVSSEYSKLLETSTIQEQIISDLAEIKSSLELELSQLKNNLFDLQNKLQESQNSLEISFNLEKALREEIKQGETIRAVLEQENQRLSEELNSKIHEIEVLTKSKEHSDRHIAILVKEKDRVVRKSDSQSLNVPNPCPSNFPAPSKIFEPLDSKVTSWGQVENQRLKASLEHEKKENSLKSLQIEKLEKENWNLLNRLRNKK